MTTITQQIITAACGALPARAAQWVVPLQAACDRFAINTPLRVAAFLSQCGVESGALTAVAEDLDYSAAALLSVFPNEFPDAALAAQYARQPEKIANRAYANRGGNGDEASGDGWRYRGRALLEISQKDNYVLCAIGVDLDLVNHPELLEQPEHSAMAAAWYWSSRKLNVLADAGNFLGLSRAINLGSATARGTPQGYAQRLALYGDAKRALGIA